MNISLCEKRDYNSIEIECVEWYIIREPIDRTLVDNYICYKFRRMVNTFIVLSRQKKAM